MKRSWKSLALALALSMGGGLAFAQEDVTTYPPMTESYAPSYSYSNAGGGVTGGAELLFLKPFFEGGRNMSAGQLAQLVGAGPNGLENTQVTWDYDVAPRIWLGYQGANGFGTRLTFMNWDHASSTTPIPGFVFTTMEASMNFLNLDAEITQAISLDDWEFVVGGGLRYQSAELEGNSFVSFGGAPPGFNRLFSSTRFDGIGPVFSLSARRQIGDFGLYSSAKAGVLAGNQKNKLQLAAAAFGNVPFDAVTDGDNVIGIGEFQLGVEWSRPIGGGARLFARTGLEAQIYLGGGGYSNDNNNMYDYYGLTPIGFNPGSTNESASGRFANSNGNVALAGYTFSFGIAR